MRDIDYGLREVRRGSCEPDRERAGLFTRFRCAPALKVTGNDLLSMVNADSGGRPAAPAGRRLRSTLVAAQLAVAVVLVVGASLLFNSFLRVTMVDPGFSPDGLTTFSMPLKRPGAPVDEQSWMAWDRLLSEVHTVAGGGEVAAASNLPFESPNWAPPILLPGEPQDFRREGVAGYVITPNFFKVARIPVRARGARLQLPTGQVRRWWRSSTRRSCASTSAELRRSA